MRYFVRLGSIMWLDDNGDERFIALSHNNELGITYFDSEELKDGSWAELDLVGEEMTPDNITLNEYWDNIRKLSEVKNA